jgi:hypothetical protein
MKLTVISKQTYEFMKGLGVNMKQFRIYKSLPIKLYDEKEIKKPYKNKA